MLTDPFKFNVTVSGSMPLPLSVRKIKDTTKSFLKALKVRQAEISIVFVNDASMRSLNKKSLGHDYVTDIITFDFSDGKKGVMEGELVIAPAMARRNAKFCGEPYAREILRYIAHGLLHLKGFDDDTDALRVKMRMMEDDLLN